MSDQRPRPDETPAHEPPTVSADSPFIPIRRPSVIKEVANQMARYVLGQNLAAGSRLPSERELGEQFGVGRSSVREALRLLEQSGLVVIRKGPTGGVFVAGAEAAHASHALSLALHRHRASMEEVLETREVVESHLACLAAQRATPDDLRHMAAIVTEIENHPHPAEIYLENNAAFHTAVAEAAHNRVLLMFMVSIRELIDQSLAHVSVDVASAAAGHREIYERIAARDGPGARAPPCPHRPVPPAHRPSAPATARIRVVRSQPRVVSPAAPSDGRYTTVAEKTVTRQDELERHFLLFPDVPREAIIKEDLLRLGLKFTADGLEKAAEGRPRSYYIFSYDMTPLNELKQAENLKAPDEVRLSGGIYGLRNTVVAARINLESPYTVDVRAGQLVLVDDGTPGTVLAGVEPPPVPRYYHKELAGGARCAEIMPVTGWGHRAFSTLIRACGYWGSKEECKFCDMNANARAQIKSGRPYTMKKKPEVVAAAAAEVFLDQPEDEPQRIHLRLSGGTLVDRNRSGGVIEDEEFYLPFIEAIREQIGNRWPIDLQTAAKDKETCRQMRASGVTAHDANIEVWDRNLFSVIVPGKDHFVGYDNWIRRVVESVDVFGQGNVCPSFVLGVEMCQPWGFKTVAEAVKSTCEGIEFLMRHGVTPRIPVWCIESGSDLYGNEPPPLELLTRVDQFWYETWKKYGLPVPVGFNQFGPGRSTCQNTAMLDIGY